MNVEEQVEQVRVDGLYFIGAEIPEEVVDFGERAGEVLAIFVVDRVDALVGMNVVHGERTDGSRRGRERAAWREKARAHQAGI